MGPQTIGTFLQDFHLFELPGAYWKTHVGGELLLRAVSFCTHYRARCLCGGHPALLSQTSSGCGNFRVYYSTSHLRLVNASAVWLLQDTCWAKKLTYQSFLFDNYTSTTSQSMNLSAAVASLFVVCVGSQDPIPRESIRPGLLRPC